MNTEISFHDAFKLLSNEDKIKIINWQKCKHIYEQLEILIYNSKDSHDFIALKQYNPFNRYYLIDGDYINNDYIIQVEKNGIIYVWSINDYDGDDFYDINILGLVDEKELFILCCQIFLYYYYKDNFDKYLNIYKFSFYYELECIQKLLYIEQKEQVKYNGKFMYEIILKENNKGVISTKKIKDYNHMSKYQDDMCGLLVLFN